MIDTISIIQQNIGKDSAKLKKVVSVVPDIIFISECIYNDITKEILKGYTIIPPKDYDEINHSTYSICLLAIKQDTGLSFESKEIKGISLNLRYITGTIKRDKCNFVQFLGVHVPQTMPAANQRIEYNQDRVEQKGEFLFHIYKFMLDNKDERAMTVGDFNTSNNNTTRFENILKEIIEISKNTFHGNTWKTKQLDYALATTRLCDETDLTSEIISESKDDHSGIKTTFTII